MELIRGSLDVEIVKMLTDMIVGVEDGRCRNVIVIGIEEDGISLRWAGRMERSEIHYHLCTAANHILRGD